MTSVDTDNHVPDASSEGAPHALVTAVVLCAGGLMVALTQTLVIPIQLALPQLLHTSAANAGWVITVTLLAGAVSMVVSGRLGDILGKQRVLVATTALLVVGSLVCAMANSLVPMLAGRALQGLAMGFIPVGIALMREVTPPHMTSTAIASMSATLGVGGAIGLPLSAWIAQDFSWHTLFWMSAVLAALECAAVVALVPHVRDAVGGSIDVVGLVGLAVGLVSVLVAISKGHEWGWLSAGTQGTFWVGVVVLVAWGFFELRQAEPLVDLRVTARASVLFTNLAAIAMGFGMMALSIVGPQLLQTPTATGYGLGQTMLQAGLWMAPSGLMMLAFAPVSSRLMTTVGPKVTLGVGGVVLGAGYLVGYVLMDAPWQILVASVVACAGVGIAYAAMPTLIMAAVPMREAGAAVGINALMRSIGTTTAATVMTLVLTSSTTSFGGVSIPSKHAYELCFLIGAVAAFVGAAICVLIPHVHTRRVQPVAPADVRESASTTV